MSIRIGQRLRVSLCAALVLLVSTPLAGCAEAASAPAHTVVPGSPDDVEPDDTDYSVDAGNNMPEYEYEDADDTLPPASVASLLCNLTPEFFQGLRTIEGGVVQVDDALRTNLVGLADLVGELDSLRAAYPEAETSIDLAHAIYAQWEQALVDRDNGNEGAAANAMRRGEELIDQLSPRAAAGCQG